MVLYVETHLVRSTLKQNVFRFFSYFFYENVALQRDTYNNHCERMQGLLQVVMYMCACIECIVVCIIYKDET
jgi:hypothetical protein